MSASKTKLKEIAQDRVRQSAIAALTVGAKAHQQGDLAGAERCYASVLSDAPDFADALQLLGVLRHQQGQSIVALDLLGRARELEPRNPNIRINLGGVLNAIKRHGEAVEEFRAALALEPHNSEVWCNLGIALRAQNAITEAAAAFERAIQFAPEAAKPRHELANLWLSVRNYAQCEAAYRGYVELVPDDAASLSNMAYAIQCQGRLDEAEVLFERAIEAASGAPELRHNLRRLLVQQGRGDEARAGLKALLKDNPNLWTAELGIAVNLMARGATEEAMAAIRDLLDAYPDNAAIWNDVALVLFNQNKLVEAADIFQKAIQIDPKLVLARNNLGATYIRMHRADLAVSVLREAMRLDPRGIDPHINLTRACRQVGDFDQASLIARATIELPDYTPAQFISPAQTFRATADFDMLDRLGDVWENCKLILPKHLPPVFLDLLVYARSTEEILAFVALVRSWAELVERQAEATPLPPMPTRRRAPGERLRIGFLSADLRDHSVARFLLPLMRNYDRKRFSFHCYSPINVPDDRIQTLIRNSVDTFTVVENKSDYEFAKTIRDDEIDLLFELNGFTESSRLDVLAWRPAPVQISWLGYPFTCGLKALDHVIVDRFVNPVDPRFLTEEPIVMSEAWVCFGEFADVAIEPGLPVDRTGRITFGTLNNPYKYTREMVALWARVLKGVPGSRFLIVRPEASSLSLIRNITGEFARNGVSADRLSFVDNRREPGKSHLSYYNEIDVSLDTFPLTGGTTTCDAAWMGVPVVSLVGDSFHQRISYSVLMHCGLEDLCAFTPDDFVAKAIALANDRWRMRSFRHELRDVIRSSPLCDQPRFLHQFQEMLDQVAAHHGIR